MKLIFFSFYFILCISISGQSQVDCNLSLQCVKNLLMHYDFAFINSTGANWNPNPCPIENKMVFQFKNNDELIIKERSIKKCNNEIVKESNIINGKFKLGKNEFGQVELQTTGIPSINIISYEYEVLLKVKNIDSTYRYQFLYKKDNRGDVVLLKMNSEFQGTSVENEFLLYRK
jgi:hypothetical protein